MGLLPNKPKPPKRQPKPYEQMTHPGERVQIDVKVVPRKCIADPQMKLYQYTAIDEFSRMRFLYAYEEQSTYSSADFAMRVVKWFKRRGITVECIQTDNGALHKILCKSKSGQAKGGLQSKRSLGFPLNSHAPAS